MSSESYRSSLQLSYAFVLVASLVYRNAKSVFDYSRANEAFFDDFLSFHRPDGPSDKRGLGNDIVRVKRSPSLACLNRSIRRVLLNSQPWVHV